jgi:hypothetical protein
MKERFTEQQIAFAVQQATSVAPVAEIMHKIGISERRSIVGRSDLPVCVWMRFAG